MLNIELIRFNDVPEDGVLDDGAFVPVSGVTSTSPPDGGCGMDGCPCVRGHFFLKLFPRDDDGIVHGFIIEADDKDELESLSPGEIADLVRRKMI
ncbi:UNVERIFIED_ORG: hypothetical protein BDU10_1214 [Burkholderia sp. CF145]